MRSAAARGAALLALLTGCAPATSRSPGDISYHRVGPLEISALVERDVTDVLGAVDLMNTSTDTVRLEYAGNCAVAILVYPALGGGREPSWDSARWWDGQGECPQGSQRLDIPPRTLARIVAPVVLAPRILGDSLPSGSYQAAMRLRLTAPIDTTLVLPAGDLVLERTASSPVRVAGSRLAPGGRVAYPSTPPSTPPSTERHP